MITITNKKQCSGCSACATACPIQCITMTEDKEGFLYPQVNKELCIKCKKCITVCPVINPFPKRTPQQCHAALSCKDKRSKLFRRYLLLDCLLYPSTKRSSMRSCI